MLLAGFDFVLMKVDAKMRSRQLVYAKDGLHLLGLAWREQYGGPYKI